MARYVSSRLLQALPILLVVSLLVFSMTRLLPGDPAKVIAGPYATPELLANIRHQLGLDQPLPVQYLTYLGKVLTGDLGTSIWTHNAVTAEILSQLPATVELGVSAVVFSSVFGVALGVLAALRRSTWFDHSSLFLAVVGMSVPQFWLGLVLLIYLGGILGLFPIGGNDAGLLSLVLPAVTLGIRPMALIARLTRASVIEVTSQPYVWTARAKGLLRRTVLFRHILRVALVPTVTVIGLELGTLLGGVIIIETVFAWPGIGRLLIQSIQSRDFPVLQGLVLFMATLFVLINLAVDITYRFLDPRVGGRSQ